MAATNLRCIDCDPNPVCRPEHEFCDNFSISCTPSISVNISRGVNGEFPYSRVSWTGQWACTRNYCLAHALISGLHAALSGASLGKTELHNHYAEAVHAAAHTDADPWQVEFSASNVAIWRVSIALEGGEPERAPEYVRRVDRTLVRTAQRRARLHLDAGRGHYLISQPHQAVQAFLAADDNAPSEVRLRPP